MLPLGPPDESRFPIPACLISFAAWRPHLSRPCTHKSRLVSSGCSLSALPPKADIRQRMEHVCFVPEADLTTGRDDHVHPVRSKADLLINRNAPIS